MSRGPKMGDDDACIQEGIYFVTKGSTFEKWQKFLISPPLRLRKILIILKILIRDYMHKYANKCKSISINDASVVVNPQEKISSFGTGTRSNFN